jgi:hypothetical protein
MLDRHGEFEKDPFSIEHIFPQSDKRWEKELTRKQFTDLRPQREQLGNLAPLPIDINRKIRNAPFVDKCEQLKDEELPLFELNTWIDNETWLKTDVTNRTGELLGVIEQRWFST